MELNKIIILARKHIGAGGMESSARLCLEDAIRLEEAGDYEGAKARALRSLAHSLGILHLDFQQAVGGDLS